MQGINQHVETLAPFFEGLKARGITSLKLADCSITQLSDRFAVTRMRWELSKSDGAMVNAINSSYVIRLEDHGWRVVGLLEMGKPPGTIP